MLFILSFLFLILLIYYIGIKNYNYWRNKGVKFEKPSIFVGNNFQMCSRNVTFSDWLISVYKRYPKERYVGFYVGSYPVLLLRDPDLIKRVLVSDFKHFHYRGLNFGIPESTILGKNIVYAEGDEWKLMRQKLTPAFSSRKLKAMFPLIVTQANKLLEASNDIAISGKEVNVYELMSKYTTDFISACGFGIDSDAIIDGNSDFLKLAKELCAATPKKIVIFILKHTFPKMFRHVSLLDSDLEKRIINLVKQIMYQRNYKPSNRNDFIDMMLELRKKEKIVGESIENFHADGTPKTVEIKIDDALLVAQVFFFFTAGFETSSFASSMLLHVLAYHPDEQARCQQDIDEALAKHDEKLCYESLNDMKYLEMALKESMRIQPSTFAILRQCTKKYTFPGTNLTIDKGVMIITPMESLHMDEQYFNNPEKFRPERFCQQNSETIDKYIYMPFGEGPRACIGGRLGMMQALAGVATILSKFTVVPSKNSTQKLQMNPKSVTGKSVIGGLPLMLKLRE